MRSADRAPRAPRTPNSALRALLTESGWTQEALARRITGMGAEAGLSLHYDRTSVAHWLRGSRPAAEVRRLLAEALSERLERPVTVAELGMGGSGGPGPRRRRAPTPAPPAPSPQPPPDDLPALETLARLAVPLALPVSGPARPGGRAPAHHHAGVAADLTSVRAHLHLFAEQAERHGGDPVRAPLAAYVSGLTRRLRTNPGGRQHRELLVGAVRLSCLLARVYADEQRHGLARRAFLTADGLAGEAGDPEGMALARRGLSSQAHQLGHHRYSLDLARAACSAAPAGTDPSARSFLYAGLAVAEAAGGGGQAPALDALRCAERELARADALGGEPVGGYQDAALRYQAGQVRARLGDRTGAVAELRSSLLTRPATERRARALSHAELAELLLAGGRLEEACAAWRIFLEDCSLVRSGRARGARARMAVLLRPYQRESCARAVLVRSGALARDAARGR